MSHNSDIQKTVSCYEDIGYVKKYKIIEIYIFFVWRGNYSCDL